jgi:hypothetical protein
VRLHVAVPAANVVLELAARRAKGVADGDVSVGVRRVLVGGAPDDDPVPGDAELDERAEEPALVVPVRPIDRDAAADDPVEQRLQVIDPIADVSFQGLAPRELVKRDL